MSKSLKKLIDINRLREFKSKLNVFESWPAGVIIPFAGTSVPSGYLLCNGALVSRTDYADLFAAVGTLYGAGDGSTTFSLPDLRDRVLQGSSSTHAAGSYIAAGLPDIIGSIGNGSGFFCYQSSSGAFSLWGPVSSAANTGYADALHPNFSFDAQKFNALYGASATVQPAAVVAQYLIRY